MTSTIETYNAPRALIDQELACVGGGTLSTSSRLVAAPSQEPDVTRMGSWVSPEAFHTFTVGQFCGCVLAENWTFWF